MSSNAATALTLHGERVSGDSVRKQNGKQSYLEMVFFKLWLLFLLLTS